MVINVKNGLQGKYVCEDDILKQFIFLDNLIGCIVEEVSIRDEQLMWRKDAYDVKFDYLIWN